MSKKLFASALAILLVITLVVPATFLIAPQRASAQGAGAITCLGGLLGLLPAVPAAVAGAAAFVGVPIVNTALPAILAQVTISAGANPVTAAGTSADCINNLVLKPLVASLIRELIRSITASTINWINGGNGTGKPSFVLNLSVHLQSVGDAIALPFINQVRAVLNPQFGAAIASSLLTKYAQGTSVGGFLAANQSTLARVSPNPAAFVGGNYSQGGHRAWFALTTQSNNNPYMLAQAAESQLGNLISQGKTNRRQDLVQGKGFLSWCGESNSSSGSNGINPGASCIENGVEGNIKTPGTVIQGYAEQVLGADLAQLINPKDIDAALVSIVGAIVKRGINEVLGGTGLFGASQTSSVRPTSVTSALYNTATTNSTAITVANTAANAAISRATEYATAWNTIAGTASSAQASATSLKNNPACTSQSGAADTALGQINSVLAQAQTALADASATQTLARQVQSEATDTTSFGVAKLNTDIQTLATMKPQAADVTFAKAQALTTDSASASPAGSLTVSGGTLVDQMNLISTNASTMSANNCPAP